MNYSRFDYKLPTINDVSKSGEEESLESLGEQSIRSIRIKGSPNCKRQILNKRSSLRSLKLWNPQNERHPGKKISSFGREHVGTDEDFLQSSARSFGDSEESARKMVNYNQNTIININLVDAPKEESLDSRSSSGLNTRADEYNALDLGGRSDDSKTLRRVSLPAGKIN